MHGPALTTGAVGLSLPTIPAGSAPHPPAVGAAAWTLSLPAIGSTATAAAPSVAPGPASLSLPAVASTATLAAPALSYTQAVTLPAIAGAPAAYPPSIEVVSPDRGWRSATFGPLDGSWALTTFD